MRYKISSSFCDEAVAAQGASSSLESKEGTIVYDMILEIGGRAEQSAATVPTVPVDCGTGYSTVRLLPGICR